MREIAEVFGCDTHLAFDPETVTTRHNPHPAAGSGAQAFAADPAAWVTARLEAGGRALLGLRGGVGPARPTSGMPDIARSYWECFSILIERRASGIAELPRAPRPTAAQLSAMDAAFGWLSRFIPDERFVLRRIVGARALVHPLTDRHLYAWRRLGRVLRADYRAVQRWHAEGIGLIAAGLAGSDARAEKIFRRGCSTAAESAIRNVNMADARDSALVSRLGSAG